MLFRSRQLVREAAELPEADGWRRTNELVLDVFGSGDAAQELVSLAVVIALPLLALWAARPART